MSLTFHALQITVGRYHRRVRQTQQPPYIHVYIPEQLFAFERAAVPSKRLPLSRRPGSGFTLETSVSHDAVSRVFRPYVCDKKPTICACARVCTMREVQYPRATHPNNNNN